MTHNKFSKALIITIALFYASSMAFSQVKEGETLERIIAIVGNDFITLSDINAQILMLVQGNPKLDPKDKNLRKQVLDALINEKLMLAKAIEDSVIVADDEINQRWDYQYDMYVQYYGSEKRIEDVYGMSINQIRAEAKDIIKKKLLTEKLQSQKFQDVKVSPREIEEFFKAYKDSLDEIPEQIEICHIVKFVEASNKAKDDMLNLAKKIRDSIAIGGNFEDFAKRYSQDPGTSSNGGNLGWFPKGKLIREFEKAAFELQPGQISLPIETPFGYHIIETLEKKKDSIKTRHILIKLGEANADVDRVKDTLSLLKKRVLGGESFEELAKQYSEEPETKGFGGLLGKMPASKLPANIKTVMDSLPVKGVSDPSPYTSNKNKSAFHIMYKRSLIPAHKPTMENDVKDIEEMAINYKRMKLYKEWLAELKEKLYWEVKE